MVITFVFTMKACTIFKNLSLFFYSRKQHFYELKVCYMHFNTLITLQRNNTQTAFKNIRNNKCIV